MSQLDYGDDGLDLKDAITVIAKEFGLSVGATLQQVRRAGISGNVRALGDGCFPLDGGFCRHEIPAFDWRGTTIDVETGCLEPSLLVQRAFSRFGGGVIRKVVVNMADLRWQIAQQLQPPEEAAAKQPPDPIEAARAYLRKRAEIEVAQGRKLKSNKELRDEVGKAVGATAGQVAKAYNLSGISAYETDWPS
jgi:hypothetical protein